MGFPRAADARKREAGRQYEIATKKERLADPLQYASCYSLDLYCDHANPLHAFDYFPETYTGETFGQCARQARRRGWVIHKDATATCPICNGY